MWKDYLAIVVIMAVTVGMLTCSRKPHAEETPRKGVRTADHITLPCVLVNIKGKPTVIMFQGKRVYAVFELEQKGGKLVPKLVFQYRVYL